MKVLIETVIFIGDIYNKNAGISNKRNFLLCKRFSEISIFLYKMVFLTYPAVVIVLFAQSIYQTISTGESVPLFAISFPDAFEKSMCGFVFKWILNIFEPGVGLTVGCSCDALIYIIFANMLFMASIITGHLDELKESLLDPDNTLRITKMRMRAICLMILKYNK